MRIAVCAKQVPDPDIPASRFEVDENALRVVPPQGVPPVMNGFDLNAAEAAIRLTEPGRQAEHEIVVISAGSGFVMEVMKKPLAMGAHRLVLVDDPALEGAGAGVAARVLSAVIRREGPFDLVLCGRQASDWDQAHVPMGIAEALGLPCITFARDLYVNGGGSLRVHRALPDGYQVIETGLPAVVTVSNEYGEPRYPTLRGIMSATRSQPTRHSLSGLGLTDAELSPAMRLKRLFVPESGGDCEMIAGEDDADAGRRLAVRLREAQLI